MEEWMQQQGGRNRSYSMSYADNISFYQQQLQHKQRAQLQPPLAPPQHQSFPPHPGMDSFLQEGSPSSMSSSGSDDSAYSSDTVVTDYTPLHQLSQHHAVEHQAPTHLQRRASLSSTPVSAATSLNILGGFVGEGLRAEYASRRPGGRRKSICLSPPENEQQMNHPGGADGLTPDSEMSEQIEAMRRSSLPGGAEYVQQQQRRNSLSCPLVHNYTPLTAVPTLGRALAEGNLGQRKSIQSFLSMLAQSSHGRSEKRRKRKGSRKGRGKRYKRNDYDESSDDDGDGSSSEEGGSINGSAPLTNGESHESGAAAAAFSGFDYSSGALAAEGSVGSDSSSDAIPLSLGDQSTPSPYEPLSGSGSDLILPPYSGGGGASAADSSAGAPAAYGTTSPPGGGGTGRPRSLSSPPYYGDGQTPLTHHQQLQRQYHIAQTNKRLQELRQQHLERLQRQMEQQQQQRPPHHQVVQQQQQQQRHSYEFTPQHFAQQPQPQPQPYQALQQVYPPQAHVLDLEGSHPVGAAVGRMASSSLPSVLPSHDLYHHFSPPAPPPEALLGGDPVHQQHQSLSQELMEQQVRADFDFYNEFSDFNMCEPASLESLCRTTPVVVEPAGDQVQAAVAQDGPVSEILDEFSVVPASAFSVNGVWLGSAGGAPQEATDGLGEKRDQTNEDLFNDFFNLDETSGVGSSH